MRSLKWFVYLLGITVWFFALMAWGPRAEAWLFPPIRADLVNATRQGEEVHFYFTGQKLRNCEIKTFVAGWRLSTGVVLPAELIRPTGEAVSTPRVAFIAGDRFNSGPFTTRVWATVDADAGAALRIITAYRCHGLWNVPVVTTIPLAEVRAG